MNENGEKSERDSIIEKYRKGRLEVCSVYFTNDYEPDFDHVSFTARQG